MDHYELIKIFRALTADIIKDNNIINDQSKKEYLECKNITIEQYCNNILKKAWADDFEIAALSKKYNLETRIIRKDGDIININNIGNDNCCIWLLFEYYHKDINYEGKNHFSCLFPKDSIYFGDIDSLKVIKKNIKCDILYKLINNNNEYQYKENDFCKINSIIDDNNNRLFIAFCNILGINKCYHKEMREIISETLKNLNKIKPNKNQNEHIKNIIISECKGNDFDIEAFAFLTNFITIKFNYDFSIDKIFGSENKNKNK